MLGWVKKKVMNASTNAMKNDITRFIEGLKGASSEEIGGMLVIATALRMNLIAAGTIPLAALNLNIPRDPDLEMECSMSPIRLVKHIKEFQSKGHPSDALGGMIWLHSVRALMVPEIRLYGRAMWKELSRGFPYSDDAIEQIYTMIGKPLPPKIHDEIMFIPVGLEPR